VIVDLYTSAFCGSCHAARATLAEAATIRFFRELR